MSSISIKHVVSELEWQQVKLLQTQLIAFEKSIRPQRKDSTGDGPFNYLKENILENNGACFLACNNEKVVGFISGWSTQGDGLDKGDNRIGYICDCYLLPKYRGKKIFKLLLNEMIEYFRNHQIKNLSTDTLGTNKDMQAILEKSGFEIHGLIYEMPI